MVARPTQALNRPAAPAPTSLGFVPTAALPPLPVRTSREPAGEASAGRLTLQAPDMQRVATSPRTDWDKIVESQGFHFHTLDERPYWDESVYYRFTSREIDELEAATYALDKMCLEAAQHVVDS